VVSPNASLEPREIFVLPVGFRPMFDQYQLLKYGQASEGSFADIQVKTNGQVIMRNSQELSNGMHTPSLCYLASD